MSLADYQSLTNDLVRDRDQVVVTATFDAAIAAAVAEYSADRPRTVTEDCVSAGGYQLPLPAAWLDGFSTLLLVEYPIGNVPTSTLPIDAIERYRSPTSILLLLPTSLAVADQVRITFTAPHQVDAVTDTTPVEHRRAIAALAAADVCDQLSNYYATESAPTIGADTVDHRSKSQTFASRARAYRSDYRAKLGLPEKRIEHASAVAVIPSTDSLGGRPLFHGRRR